MGWRQDPTIELTDSDYLELVGLKTCWYTTIYPLRAGALIGSRGNAHLANLNSFGFYLGAAFQIRDDLLNLIGSVERYGKELGGDIVEGKRTLMLIDLLEKTSGDEREFLIDFLSRRACDRSADDTARILELMHREGSIAFAVEYGKGVAAAAHEQFDSAFSGVAPSDHTAFLQGLVRYMLERDF